MQDTLEQCWRHLQQNRPEAALASLWELDKAWRDDFDRLRLQGVLEAMTTVECWLGRLSLAERQAKRAIARATEVQGEKGPQAARALLTLARVYWRQNREEEALRLVEQALECAADDWELEAWQWAHKLLACMRCGRLPEAQQAALTLDPVLRSRYRENHPNVLAFGVLRCRLSRLMGQNEVTGKLINSMEEYVQDQQDLLAPYYGERALYSLTLQRWEEASRFASMACRASEQRANFCRVGSTRLFEILATAHMEMEQTELALAILNRAEAQLRWPTDRLIGEGFFAPVLWPQNEVWPLLWPGWSWQDEVQCWLDVAGRRARLYRRMGQEDEARAVAREAKLVRQTKGEARLSQGLNPALTETIMIRAKFSASERVPTHLGWESARGELEWVGADERGKLLALHGPTRELLQADSAFFSSPLPNQPTELFIYAKDARSSQKSAVPYTIWVGFDFGPPLRIPIQV